MTDKNAIACRAIMGKDYDARMKAFRKCVVEGKRWVNWELQRMLR